MVQHLFRHRQRKRLCVQCFRFLHHILYSKFSFSSSSSSSYSVFVQSSPFSRNGRIHPIPSAIAYTPSLHFPCFREFFFFKPIVSVSSSTCFFKVFFGDLCFFLPFSSKFRATLETLSSSFLSTCPHHLTLFAVSNRSIVSLNPNMSICFLAVFLPTTF